MIACTKLESGEKIIRKEGGALLSGGRKKNKRAGQGCIVKKRMAEKYPQDRAGADPNSCCHKTRRFCMFGLEEETQRQKAKQSIWGFRHGELTQT